LGGSERGFAIVPERLVTGRTLMFLIAIMTFLSSVTLGAVLLVQQSAVGWSADIGRQVTIQIMPEAGQVMASNLRTAVALAEATPGVASTRVLSEAEGRALLEPWFGTDFDLSALSIPRLIVVQLSNPKGADIDQLATNLANAVPGASVDTHDLWRTQLNSMAGTIVISGLLVFALIVAATVLAVIFSTLGTMASNREIVDVLHFIGASNRFIAAEFQSRFLAIGLQGGAMGGGAALLFFFAAGFITGSVLPVQNANQISVFFGYFGPGLYGLIGLVVVVLVIAGLTGLTSRVTVHRFLARISV
jgi:cell division transport system permease protein